MVDVGGKDVTRRAARAGARVWMAPETLDLLREQALPKGDVLAVAKVAGIMAAKRTSEFIPLCHPLSLTQVDITFAVADDEPRVDIECVTRTEDRTGVEMEALVGAAIAAITVYDMCKAVDRGMIIGDIRLLEKTGGKEDYVRPAEASAAAGAEAAGSGAAAPAIATPLAAPPAPIVATPAAVPPAAALAGTVVSVNVSAAKGERKTSGAGVTLRVEHGIEGDAHAGTWHRQVSLLAQESIEKMKAAGLDVGPGDFAENITTQGLDVASLPLETVLELGEALVEVTQIGKECHTRCAIYHQAGDCVMPREGIFVRVLRGGRVAPGDPVKVRAWGLGPSGVGATVVAAAAGTARAAAQHPGAPGAAAKPASPEGR
jgi:cyclic pyranopterin phosphate synthase